SFKFDDRSAVCKLEYGLRRCFRLTYLNYALLNVDQHAIGFGPQQHKIPVGDMVLNQLLVSHGSVIRFSSEAVLGRELIENLAILYVLEVPAPSADCHLYRFITTFNMELRIAILQNFNGMLKDNAFKHLRIVTIHTDLYPDFPSRNEMVVVAASEISFRGIPIPQNDLCHRDPIDLLHHGNRHHFELRIDDVVIHQYGK